MTNSEDAPRVNASPAAKKSAGKPEKAASSKSNGPARAGVTKAAASKPAQAKSTSAKRTSKTAKPKTAPKASPETTNATKAGAKVSTGRFSGVRGAIDLPVEAVLGAANRVGGLVSPVTERVQSDARVNALRDQVEEILKQVERRGSSVRDDAERRVSEIKANEKLKVLGDRAEKVQMDLTRVLETQSARAQELIGHARGQISALRH